MNNMAASVIEAMGKHVLIAVHTSTTPSKDEWERYLRMTAEVIEESHGNYVGLAVTDGGAPNSAQRAALVPLAKKAPEVRGAAITNSILVRGIMTAMSWLLNPNFKSFTPEELAEALTHLQVHPMALTRVRDEIVKLQKELPPVATIQAMTKVPLQKTG
jgi:hypothetical protein